MSKFQGKTALITGASRGIGRAIAFELAQQGIRRLILVARNHNQLNQLADELSLFSVDTVVLPLDLTDFKTVASQLNQVWREQGPIDLLINCAGVAYQTPFLQSKLNQVYDEISLNLLGTYTVTRLIARRMASRRQGTIVNVSSLMGKVAAPTMATYSATKFALLGFTQALRGELSPYNVQVVALLPSLTDTDMANHVQPFRWVQSLTPAQVAQALTKGLQRNASEIVVGWQSRLAIWGHKVMPWWVEKFVAWASPLRSNPLYPSKRVIPLT